MRYALIAYLIGLLFTYIYVYKVTKSHPIHGPVTCLIVSLPWPLLLIGSWFVDGKKKGDD